MEKEGTLVSYVEATAADDDIVTVRKEDSACKL